jgi:hypothetical protein
MKLARLLDLHLEKTSEVTLQDNLGDSYLYSKNKIYKAIRDECLKNNFYFSSDYDSSYLALPLAELENILNNKKIPYFNNVDVLKNIEKQKPNLADWSDIADNLKKNFLFHESCHAVARSYRNNKPEGLESKVLNQLIEESFANTCELLGIVYAEAAAHRIFYEINSYTALIEQKTNLKNAFDELGFEFIFKVTMLGYLHSNHLHDSMDDLTLKRIIALTDANKKLSDKHLKTIKFVLRNCFNLDNTFKQVTTRFYMKLNTLETTHSNLKNVNYLSDFENNTNYRLYLNHLTDLLVAKA